MSKKVVIESTLRDGILSNLMIFLKKNLPHVRGFDGCLRVTVFLDSEARRMIFDEEWLSVEAHQKYISTIASNGIMNELVSFLEAPPEIKYLDRVSI